jgi:hypothetical protein
MDARPVDPRDTTWEDDGPVFRATFFGPAPGGSVSPGVAVSTDEWEVRGADVHEVIAWAERKADTARTWELHLLVDDGRRGRGMVRLRGTDPNRGTQVDFTMSVRDEGAH